MRLPLCCLLLLSLACERVTAGDAPPVPALPFQISTNSLRVDPDTGEIIPQFDAPADQAAWEERQKNPPTLWKNLKTVSTLDVLEIRTATYRAPEVDNFESVEGEPKTLQLKTPVDHRREEAFERAARTTRLSVSGEQAGWVQSGDGPRIRYSVCKVGDTYEVYVRARLTLIGKLAPGDSPISTSLTLEKHADGEETVFTLSVRLLGPEDTDEPE